MNFIRYDPITGDILQMGWMASEFVLQEIEEGKPTIPHDDYLEWGQWRVNPAKKELEQISVTE